jgi:hypothetical protein
VGDLDARHGTGGLDGGHDAGQAGGLLVVPQAGRQPGVMRPSGATAVASTMTSPAPPRARPA